MWSNILDRISFWSLFSTVTLLPLFFLPFSKISVQTSKGLLLVIGLAVAVMFYLMARFSDGRIIFPKSPLILSGLLVVIATLLSAFFSASPALSFFGIMLDVGSFWFILCAFFLMFMAAVILGNRESARMVLLGVLAVSAVIFLFQILRFMAPAGLSLGVLGGKTGNILGSWNSLGLFAGLSALMTVFVLEFFTISRTGKWLLTLLLALSLFMIAVVNFGFVWDILGIFALIIFVYKISYFSSTEEGAPKPPFPAYSFAAAMIALLFFTSGQFIGSYLPQALGVSNTEVGPNLQGTFVATKEVIRQSPVLGSGPNTFSQAWALYKAPTINTTIFWNTSFNAGSGLLPTFIATTGILGILAWGLFLVIFLVSGIKNTFSNLKRSLNPELVVFFVAALYLMIASFFYYTGGTLFLLALAFTGIFMGVAARSAEMPRLVSWQILGNPRNRFVFILVAVVLVITTATGAFKYITRFVSIPYFERAVAAESLPDAETAIQRAVSLHPNDFYLRVYSQVYLVKLNNLVSKGSQLTEAEQAELQPTFARALDGAMLAVSYNPVNSLNHLMLGGVYSTGAALGVTDAAAKAKETYTQAQTLNPTNPAIKLALARVAIIERDLAEAKALANQALELKPNYVDALIILSQISRTEGNRAESIAYAERALALAPQNAALQQYVASLRSGSTPTVPGEIDSGEEN